MLNCAGFMVNETSFSHGTGGATRMDHIVSTFLECIDVVIGMIHFPGLLIQSSCSLENTWRLASLG